VSRSIFGSAAVVVGGDVDGAAIGDLSVGELCVFVCVGAGFLFFGPRRVLIVVVCVVNRTGAWDLSWDCC
jgi:hypothetical protein